MVGEAFGRNLWGTAMLDLPINRILIGIAVFIGLAAVMRHVMTRRPAIETDPEGERGQVAPNRALLAVICLIGVALAGAAVFAALRGVGGLPVLAVALAALVMTGMMVTAFFPFYDITWDADGIEGPTLLLPPPSGQDGAKSSGKTLRWPVRTRAAIGFLRMARATASCGALSITATLP